MITIALSQLTFSNVSDLEKGQTCFYGSLLFTAFSKSEWVLWHLLQGEGEKVYKLKWNILNVLFELLHVMWCRSQYDATGDKHWLRTLAAVT